MEELKHPMRTTQPDVVTIQESKLTSASRTQIQIQNLFLTAQSTQIKSVISVPIKDLFITILGHCLTTYPGSVRTFTTYPGRDALLQHTRVGAQFNDIPGSRIQDTRNLNVYVPYHIFKLKLKLYLMNNSLELKYSK